MADLSFDRALNSAVDKSSLVFMIMDKVGVK
jgi:hypothetical protein